MRIEQLEFVLAVAEQKSMLKAAQMLHTSVQNVSKAIKQLEDELGIQLFIRNKFGAFLTTDGEKICQQAQYALEHIGAIWQLGQSKQLSHAQEHVNIRIITAMSLSQLTFQGIDSLKDRFVLDRLVVSTKDAALINNDLISKGTILRSKYDLIVSHASEIDYSKYQTLSEAWQMYYMGKNTYGIKIAKKSALAQREKLSVKDVLQLPMIAIQPEEDSFSYISLLMRSYGFLIEPRIIVSDAREAERYIDNDMGYAFVTLNDKIKTTEQVIIPLKEDIYDINFLLIRKEIAASNFYQALLKYYSRQHPDMFKI